MDALISSFLFNLETSNQAAKSCFLPSVIFLYSALSGTCFWFVWLWPGCISNSLLISGTPVLHHNIFTFSAMNCDYLWPRQSENLSVGGGDPTSSSGCAFFFFFALIECCGVWMNHNNHNKLHLPFVGVAYTEQKKSLRSSPTCSPLASNRHGAPRKA